MDTEVFADIKIENGIVICVYHPGEVLTLEVAKKLVNRRLELQDNKDYPVLFHISLNKATKSARNYMKKEGIEGIISGAFIVDSILTKSILNFFLMVSKPKVPAKLFTERKDALIWLEQFKE